MIIIVDSSKTNPAHSVVTQTHVDTGITRTLEVAARAVDVIAWVESDPNSGMLAPAPELEVLVLA